MALKLRLSPIRPLIDRWTAADFVATFRPVNDQLTAQVQ